MPNITIEEYQLMLDNHDWYYDYSDDHRVWRKGSDSFHNLMAIAKNEGGEFKARFNNELEKRKLYGKIK